MKNKSIYKTSALNMILVMIIFYGIYHFSGVKLKEVADKVDLTTQLAQPTKVAQTVAQLQTSTSIAGLQIGTQNAQFTTTAAANSRKLTQTAYVNQTQTTLNLCMRSVPVNGPSYYRTILCDPFVANTNLWEGKFQNEDDFAISGSDILNGVYQWTFTAKMGFIQWEIYQKPLKNFEVLVESNLKKGTISSYDLIFRETDNGFYVFSVDPINKLFWIGLSKNDDWVTLVDWTESDIININRSNWLGVSGNGANIFKFYINGKEVANMQNSEILVGNVGIGVTMDAGETAIIEFDNFILRTP
jgi:hypothetical protein